MRFTAPAVLWALPLSLLPLLLHLLSRRRAKRVLFSDLFLLRRVRARALPRTRLREWTLLAVRCLALLSAVLAYSGPVLEGPAAGGAGQGRRGLDLVVLADLSYSMSYREQGRTRLEQAAAQAREALLGLDPGDRAALVAFSDRLEDVPGQRRWTSPGEAAAALARLEPGPRGTDYAPALAEAARLLKGSKGRRRAVLLLSDGAAHGRRAALPELDDDVVLLAPGWGPSDNGYLSMAGPARESTPAAPRLAVRAEGLERGRTRSLDIVSGGRKLETLTVQAEHGGRAVTAALPRPRAGRLERPAWSGRAVLRSDALSADDAYYFSFRHARRPRLLCLHGDGPDFFRAPSAGYFLKELLGPSDAALLPYRTEFLDVVRWREVRLDDFDAVVLAAAPRVSTELSAELERFVRRGGGFWLIPHPAGDPDAAAALTGLLPAQFGPVVPGEGRGMRPGEAPQPRLWREFLLGRVVLARYHLLQVREGAKVAFRSASGYPLLVWGGHGRGRAAVWAAALDADWSNLVLKPVFPAFFSAVVGQILSRREDEGPLELKAGEPLVRRWGPEEAAPASVLLRPPDGRRIPLQVRDRRVVYPATEVPGLYELADPVAGHSAVYAVNLDRSQGESDLSALPDPPWRLLPARTLSADLRRALLGRDARSWMLGAAALLLALEALLAVPRAAAVLVLLLAAGIPARAQMGDRLAWAQLRLGPDWDPYPTAGPEILGYMSSVTSVLTSPQRRVLTLDDDEVFTSPVLVLAGRRAPEPLSESGLRTLRHYLTGGGTLWIEDVSGQPRSTFDRWVRDTLEKSVPEARLSPLPPGHVVYKTFFLLRGPAGRVMVRGSLEGLEWGGRTAVLYSRNDVLGAWPRDALGAPLLPCVPGGESQRRMAHRLSVNMLMYALTGSYKADAVHQPFLLQKLRVQPP